MYKSFNATAVGLAISAAATVELAARGGFAEVDLSVHDLLDAGEDPRAVRMRMDEAPNFGIVLDGGHLYAAGESVEAGLAWGIERVVWVHVADLPKAARFDRFDIKDNDRGLPGESGAIDSTALLNRLSDAGYDGPVTAEPMAGCRTLAGQDAEAIVRHVATALRSVWPQHRLR